MKKNVFNKRTKYSLCVVFIMIFLVGTFWPVNAFNVEKINKESISWIRVNYFLDDYGDYICFESSDQELITQMCDLIERIKLRRKMIFEVSQSINSSIGIDIYDNEDQLIAAFIVDRPEKFYIVSKDRDYIAYNQDLLFELYSIVNQFYSMSGY